VIDNWRKSTRSANNGACVETGWAGGLVGYRDTKQAALPDAERLTLLFSNAAAGVFLSLVRSHEGLLRDVQRPEGVLHGTSHRVALHQLSG
jgi:hypothetical protein